MEIKGKKNHRDFDYQRYGKIEKPDNIKRCMLKHFFKGIKLWNYISNQIGRGERKKISDYYGNGKNDNIFCSGKIFYKQCFNEKGKDDYKGENVIRPSFGNPFNGINKELRKD